MAVGGGFRDSLIERFKTRYEHFMDTRSARFAVWLLRITRGRVTRLWRRRALVLTTHGQRSGRRREVPIQYFPDGDDVIVVAANSGMPSPPGWYFNLTADPRVIIEIDGRRRRALAEELGSEEAEAWWPRVLETAPDYARYLRRTGRRLPLVRLSPVTSADADPTGA